LTRERDTTYDGRGPAGPRGDFVWDHGPELPARTAQAPDFARDQAPVPDRPALAAEDVPSALALTDEPSGPFTRPSLPGATEGPNVAAYFVAVARASERLAADTAPGAPGGAPLALGALPWPAAGGHGDDLGLTDKGRPAQLPGGPSEERPDLPALPLVPQAADLLTRGLHLGLTALDQALRDWAGAGPPGEGPEPVSLYWLAVSAWLAAAGLAAAAARRTAAAPGETDLIAEGPP
jgi:hypothetical protein